jgi:hypothetical protein
VWASSTRFFLKAVLGGVKHRSFAVLLLPFDRDRAAVDRLRVPLDRVLGLLHGKCAPVLVE